MGHTKLDLVWEIKIMSEKGFFEESLQAGHVRTQKAETDAFHS